MLPLQCSRAISPDDAAAEASQAGVPFVLLLAVLVAATVLMQLAGYLRRRRAGGAAPRPGDVNAARSADAVGPSDLAAVIVLAQAGMRVVVR